MGKVADFSSLPYAEAAAGVKRAPITGSEMKQMSSEIIRLAPGASLSEAVPAGSDRYFYTLTGTADKWTLDLVPIDEKLAAQVRSLRLTGKGGEVLGIEMEFIGGDRSVMVVTPVRGAS